MVTKDLDFVLSDEFMEFIEKHEEPWKYSWTPCPRCGSRKVTFKAKIPQQNYALQNFAWAVFIILSGILPGLILFIWSRSNKPSPARDFICKDCRLQWNKEDLMT